MDIKYFLNDTSKTKLKQFPFDLKLVKKLHPELKKLLERILNASSKKIILEKNSQPPIKEMVSLFQQFNNDYNEDIESKFNRDLETMDKVISFDLITNSNRSTINFLLIDKYQLKTYVPYIIHIVNTFFYTFPINYNNLTLNICLDDNKRELPFYKMIELIKKDGYDKIFKYLQKKSGAFTVAGVTRAKEKIISMTKNEEIIKMIMHELFHYIKFDNFPFYGTANEFSLSVKKNLNLSEAYTEFMSILLKCAYQAIQISTILKTNVNDIYSILLYLETRYSIYLSANILKFYGYDEKTFYDFFKNKGNKHISTIAIWEYIILRTQLLLNVDKVCNLMGRTWKITENNKDELIELMKIDDHFLDELFFFMKNTKPIDNISYSVIEFDLEKFES